MKIIIDAMGGDNAPDEIVKGALDAVRELGCEVVLTGRGEDIRRVLRQNGHEQLPDGIGIAEAADVVEIEDDPATVIRTKKNSSLVVALNLLSGGHGDALVSAGSTGALLSGATLIVKRVRGVRRAALALYTPNAANGFILLDCGANCECTPEYLLQFAYMGSYFAEDTLSLERPRVGLLNIGGESTKGTPLQLEAYALLEAAGKEGRLNFVGNVEPPAAMNGACDVLVTDGYTGNVFLKTVEGTAKLIMTELKSAYMKNIVTKLSALMIKKHIRTLKTKMNPDAIGGTALLGISKPVIKAHGSSMAPAITSAVRQAVNTAKSGMADKLRNSLAKTVDKTPDSN